MIDRRIILDSFARVRANTIEIARDIPAEQYSFLPAPETRTVLTLFKDIIRITEFMTGLALHPEEVDLKTTPREEWFKRLCPTDYNSLTGKDEILAALQRSMDDIQQRVNAADEQWLNTTFLAPDGITKVRLWVVQCAKEQEMALRGQLFLIERMLGIVPHTTRRQQEKERLRQEREQARQQEVGA